MAEPVYVANSEPAIWVYGGGRADVVERVPISDEQPPKCTEAGRHTGRSCVLPREAPWPAPPCQPGAVENRTANGDPAAERGQGVTDLWRTDDSGPMKPGNSVEDNTLTTEGLMMAGNGNGAMAVLNGHEAGNGGYSQDATYSHRAAACRRTSSDALPPPAGRGKPWTRGERDNVGEPYGRARSQRNQDGEG